VKTIIAGSRWIVGPTARLFLYTNIRDLPWEITEVVSGRARGIDTMGEQWARAHIVPIKPFIPDWYPNGPGGALDRRAGFKRNEEMATYADALLAVWDGTSRGTKDMIERAKRHNLRVEVRLWLGDKA
jgi:hypothetical protein